MVVGKGLFRGLDSVPSEARLTASYPLVGNSVNRRPSSSPFVRGAYSCRRLDVEDVLTVSDSSLNDG